MPTRVEILQNLMVVVQTGPTERAGVREASRLERELHARGQPYGVLVYLSAQTSLPDEEDRKAISGMVKQTSRATGMAVVLDGTGFFAAAMRGVGVALSSLAGVPMPIYRSLDEGLEALSKALEGRGPADAAVKELIARHLSLDES